MQDLIQKIKVWDFPTRVFHWAMVICFIGAIASDESEKFRLYHVFFGYTMLGLVGFRILWGVIGTKYAKFSNFIPSPASILSYIRSLLARKPEHHIGHNPIGALAIYILLALVMLISISGILIYNDLGGVFFEKAHDYLGHLIIFIVLIHIAGVVFSSILHKENLVRSMITGFKQGALSDQIDHVYFKLGIIMVIAMAIFAYLFFTP